jgi:hypothetical protein
MAEKKKRDPSAKGELRRRHRALIETGVLARLRSEGRLMLCYALYWANFEQCTVSFSFRGAAKMLGVQPNAAMRGVRQLLEAGALAQLPADGQSSRRQYEILPSNGAHTSGVRRAHEPCTGAHTSGVQSAHERCAQRTRAVYGAHTSRVRLSSISLGNSIITQREIQGKSAPDRGGLEPPGGGNPSTLLGGDGDGRAAAPLASEDTLTEEVRSDTDG